MTVSRRLFLKQSVGTLPFWGLGAASAQEVFTNVSSGTATVGFPGMIVRNTEPQNLEFPFASLKQSILPTEQFFVRSHFPVPKIDMKTWRLRVEGAVETPLEFTLEDLGKFASRTQKATLECAGNGRVFLTPSVPGLQWGHGAVGNAEWSGVPLAAILEKAGVKPSAVEVILEGADKGQINSDPKSPGPISYARSIPLAKAKKPETLLALQMNGASLTASHGYPVRAVVSGWYGMSAVKWLTKIIVTEKPFGGFWQTLDYSYWERKSGQPSIIPLTTMEVKAAIARPALQEVIEAQKPYRVTGAAWAGENRVAKVEVSTDAGKTWAEAKLLEKPQNFTWVLWEYLWEKPTAGNASLVVRATDDQGQTQPLTRDPDRRSYMINHQIPTEVIVR